MLKKIRKMLSGKSAPSTAAEFTAAIAEIDLDQLRVAADAAAQRRAELLLTGSTAEILAAEREVTEARIAVERAEALRAELERRRAEAEAAERRQELERRHAEVQAKVDAAVARIEAEYPAAAATIAELAALASDADAAAREWALEVFEAEAAGFPAVDSVASRVGWLDEYFSPPDFADAPVLPPAGDFAGFNCEKAFVTHLKHYALTGGGGGARLAAQLERGPRWVEA